MGLDMSHGAWSSSYSTFNRYREVLAEIIGLPLNEMEGFTENGKKWDSVPHDDLFYLINHSDCDGHITAIRAGKVAKRLREILKDIPDYPGIKDYWREKTKALIEGFEEASKIGEKIEFR